MQARRRKMRIKPISLCVLLSVGVAHASAQRAGSERGHKETARTYYIQNVYMDRDSARQPQQQPPAEPPRRNGDPGQTDSSGFGGPREGHANSSAENARKQGRLSPEERRTLRRQIDEMSHDIYAPRR